MDTKSDGFIVVVIGLVALIIILGVAAGEKSHSRSESKPNYHIDLTLHGYIVTNDSGLDTTISIGELEEFFINDNL